MAAAICKYRGNIGRKTDSIDQREFTLRKNARTNQVSRRKLLEQAESDGHGELDNSSIIRVYQARSDE